MIERRMRLGAALSVAIFAGGSSYVEPPLPLPSSPPILSQYEKVRIAILAAQNGGSVAAAKTEINRIHDKKSRQQANLAEDLGRAAYATQQARYRVFPIAEEAVDGIDDTATRRKAADAVNAAEGSYTILLASNQDYLQVAKIVKLIEDPNILNYTNGKIEQSKQIEKFGDGATEKTMEGWAVLDTKAQQAYEDFTVAGKKVRAKLPK
jgi:hypothetical protein